MHDLQEPLKGPRPAVWPGFPSRVSSSTRDAQQASPPRHAASSRPQVPPVAPSFPGFIQTPSCQDPTSLLPGLSPPRVLFTQDSGGCCPSPDSEPSKSMIHFSSINQAEGTDASPGYTSGPREMDSSACQPITTVQVVTSSRLHSGPSSGLPARTPQGKPE